MNRKIQRIADGLGRLVTVNEQDVTTGQLTQATNYSYDYLGNLTQVNQGNQLRSFKYDSIGRLRFEKIPEQTATINDGTGTFWTSKYTYTTFDAIATKQDARGVITTFAYDGMNRVTQTSYNTVGGVITAPAVSYVYDSDPTYGTAGDGMLLRVNVGTDYQERYTIDPVTFRVTSTVRTIGSRTYTSSYQYNQASQLTQLTYPSSRSINVSYDSIGRLNGLAEPLPGPNSSAPSYLRSVSYNTAGQVTGDIIGGTQFSWGYTGGVTEQYGYDANRMQLTSQKAGTASPYTNGMDLTYSYSASAGQMGSGSTAGNAGQLMSISGTIGGLTESGAYSYDNLGRLVTSNQTSNSSSAQRRFAYDRWGNRTGMWDATSGGNQIQSIALQQSGGAPTNQIASVTSGSTVNYTYDAAGNVTNDGVHSYGYDSENRLVTVDGGATASCAYDHQNRRYKKTVGSTVTHYVWQGSQVLAEHNGSTGAVLIDYVYSGSRMIAKVASGSTQYLLSDRLSVRLSLDSSGNVLGRQSHLPFGEDFAESGSQEKHHFTSYEREGETSSDYAVNRGYPPGLGRFISVDRIAGNLGIPQRLNRYSYTTNDPVNKVDPLGLDAVKCTTPRPCPAGQEWSVASCACVIKLHGEDEYPREPGEDNPDLPDWEHTPLIIDGGFGEIPGPRELPSQCVVTVTARKLQGDLGRRFDHLFITTWDTSTNRTSYFGAGGVGGSGPHIGGLLVGTADVFDAGHAGADFENPNIVKQWTEVLGGTCDDLNKRLATATGRINDKKLKYDGLFGPNSNSFAYTLLKQGNFVSLILQIDSWQRANSFWIIIPGTPIPVKMSPIPGWGQDIL